MHYEFNLGISVRSSYSQSTSCACDVRMIHGSFQSDSTIAACQTLILVAVGLSRRSKASTYLVIVVMRG